MAIMMIVMIHLGSRWLIMQGHRTCPVWLSDHTSRRSWKYLRSLSWGSAQGSSTFFSQRAISFRKENRCAVLLEALPGWP